MVLAALLALASGWTIGAPPAGHELVAAEQRAGERVTRYARTRRDPDDAPVVLTAYDPGARRTSRRPPPQTTVRGRPAEFSDLTDDGRTYGRALRWIEPSGVTLSLELASRPSDERLRAIAESVREEPPERWRVLRIAMSDPPELGRLPAGMKRVIVRRGRIAGRRFTLTALLPPGFPVAPEDRRAACYRLTFRGERSYGVSCGFETSWWRLGGTVFAFGSVAPRSEARAGHRRGCRRQRADRPRPRLSAGVVLRRSAAVERVRGRRSRTPIAGRRSGRPGRCPADRARTTCAAADPPWRSRGGRALIRRAGHAHPRA